jgi:hypothetical protein
MKETYFRFKLYFFTLGNKTFSTNGKAPRSNSNEKSAYDTSNYREKLTILRLISFR